MKPHTQSLSDSYALGHRPNGALTCTVVVLKPQLSMFAFMNKIVCCCTYFTVYLNTCSIGSFIYI